ncbi:hypothetical protein C8A05DRAFT_37827 [Staphylotrichum tortipilum]|uniref:Uncharacterized protein n=1 Tax=Staphylotrichum tortipilum TaxID=2831512 RepID=A0AAN6MEH5_9PEZI|nr:hypothetical protein C8A05DRAFT_37827 [Staphylotrichum longicolle]
MADPIPSEPALALTKTYIAGLKQMIKNKEPLSNREKRFLLRTEGMTPTERQLLIDRFWLRDHELLLSRHQGFEWTDRLGVAGRMVFKALRDSAPPQVDAHRQVHALGGLPLKERTAEMRAASAAADAAMLRMSVEEMQAYDAENMRMREQSTAMRKRAAERREAQVRALREYDARLFAEAEESMRRMADELEGDTCECDLCVRLEAGMIQEGP